MRFKQVGNKSDLVGVVIRNNDTVTMNPGQPVVLSMDAGGYGSENNFGGGVDVVLPSTAGSINLIWALRYGVNLKSTAINQFGEAQVFGFCNNLAIILMTRANSGASWSTFPNLSIGNYLTVDTVNNYFATMASTIPYLTISTQAAASSLTIFDAFGVIGQTMSTVAMAGTTFTLTAGSASSTANTLTAITASIQAFVRMM